MLITYNLEIYSKVLYVFKLDKYWSKGAFLYNLSNNNVQRSNDTLIGCLLTNSCVKNRNMTKYNNKNSIFWSWWMQSHWSPIKWPITHLIFNLSEWDLAGSGNIFWAQNQIVPLFPLGINGPEIKFPLHVDNTQNNQNVMTRNSLDHIKRS